MVPLAFLVGVLRSRLARVAASATSCSRSAGERRSATRSPARSATRRSRSRTGCRSGSGSSPPTGKPLPDAGRHARRTLVEHAGRPTAALLHDPLLADEPELVEAVAAAAGLWLDNERLQAELRAQVAFLETIVNTSPSLLCSLDREGRIANLNDAACERERLRPRERRQGAAVLGRLRRARRSGSECAPPLRGGRARPRGGELRAHVRQPAGRGADDRVVDGAALRRRRERPQRRLRRARHHRAQAAGVRAGRASATSCARRRRDAEPARRRRPRGDGRRQLGQQGLRAHDRLDGAGRCSGAASSSLVQRGRDARTPDRHRGRVQRRRAEERISHWRTRDGGERIDRLDGDADRRRRGQVARAHRAASTSPSASGARQSCARARSACARRSRPPRSRSSSTPSTTRSRAGTPPRSGSSAGRPRR